MPRSDERAVRRGLDPSKYDGVRHSMLPLSRLNYFFADYRRLYIPGLLFTIISAIFAIAVPMIVRQAVDSIPRFVALFRQFRGTELEGPLYADLLISLLLFGMIVIGLSVASGVCSFLMRQTVVVASRHIEFDLRNSLYAHIQKLSRRYYARTSTGDVITRSTSDIEQVRRYIGPAVMYITRAIVIMVTAIIAMLVISPRLTAYALLPMPILAVAIFFVAHLVHSRSVALQRQYASLTSRVQEALSGIRVLKAYAREESEAEAFEAESTAYKVRVLSLAKVEAAWRPVFVTVIGISQILVVWMGGRLVTEGIITIGNIVEYMIYIALITWPVAALGFVISMVQRASASISRIHDILDTKPEIYDSNTTDHSIQELAGRIVFEDVSFRYEENGPWALHGVSFTLPAGGILAVVGHTGSGKSTLVELIARSYDPTEGVVRVDGEDARKVPVDVLRAGMGYVPQDVFLFSDTIGANIAFGDLEAGSDRIEEAATEAELLDNVLDFPDGFETFVGERGVTLSGGQKQRTSLARALVRSPRILLLDDALSSVDTKTEHRILGHLRRRYGQRTVVIVSHRISTVQDADTILVLEEGGIVEEGNHQSLVEAGGRYARLYRQQLLEAELEAL